MNDARSCRVKITVTIHRLSRLIPTFRSLFLEHQRRRVSWQETLHSSSRMVESSGVRSEVRLGHTAFATCAPIRRVNLPTCFASRRIISRARDIDFSIPLYRPSTHHRLIGISYAASVPTVTGYCCPVVYSPSSCL